MNRTVTKRVIVNADDLGFSPGITAGVLQAHHEGVVTSATLTANMPDAEAAVRALAEAPNLGVGVHLNACQGPCLSGGGGALADADGVMRRSAAAVVLACLCRPGLLEAVEAEFEAQIQWALDHGLRPTHLDSHRHIHAFGPIFRRVAKLARRYHIPFVRRYGADLADRRGARPRQVLVSRALMCLDRFNAELAGPLWATHGTMGVADTGRIDSAWLVRAAAALRPGVTEIMTHPGRVEPGLSATTRLLESRQRELRALCDPAVREALDRNGIELTDYGQLLRERLGG